VSSTQDIKDRISSVKNIHKITRAMEMVAAARLRRAEHRIEVLRPYAEAIRRMTARATQATQSIPDLPLLQEHDSIDKVGLLLLTGDRGLAGSFNSQIMRAGNRRMNEIRSEESAKVEFYVVGRRGASSVEFRGLPLAAAFTGFTDRPSYSDARDVADTLISAYVDGEVDRVEMFYNGYISPMSQDVRRETLLPLQQAEVLAGGDEEDDDGSRDERQEGDGDRPDHSRALWIYEPGPEEILERLAPDYVEISIYRAMLESTASEHGARMTAMRSASDNAEEIIDDLTMEANRQRQADITQEIMEVVAGAEALQ
jgi:F-type H+-transporting ATPase subunit gamma